MQLEMLDEDPEASVVDAVGSRVVVGIVMGLAGGGDAEMAVVSVDGGLVVVWTMLSSINA